MASLKTLRAKLAARVAGFKRQNRKAKKTGKAGHRKQARIHRRAIKKLKALIVKWFRLHPKSGTGAWQGSKSIIVNEVLPVGRRWGIAVTSRKRWQTYGNPGSDHYRGNKDAYAVDFATDSNFDFGVAIGKSLGVPYGGSGSDYNNFYITRAGHTFRVQLICGTHGTGPHCHCGIRRV